MADEEAIDAEAPLASLPDELSIAQLARACGLDPDWDFRGRNLKHYDFRGADLRGVDFSMARLQGARLDGAQISGAHFDQAILGNDGVAITDLSVATDYAQFAQTYRPSPRKLHDRSHLPIGAVYFAAPGKVRVHGRKLIAVVDDEHTIRRTLATAFETEGYDVNGYGDGVSALEGLNKDPADLVISNIKMPLMDGMELLRRLRQSSSVPFVFLTSKDEEIDQLFGLKMGADDYLTKPFSLNLVVQRVKAVLRRSQTNGDPGSSVEAIPIIELGKLRLDPERHTCHWDGKPVTLTISEFLILQALANRPGVIKTRDALMDAAYDDQVYVDDRTIDSHIKRLRKKFRRVADDFDSIETLYGVGYRYRE